MRINHGFCQSFGYSCGVVWGKYTNLKWIEEGVISVELMKDNLWKSFFCCCNQNGQVHLIVKRDMTSRIREVGGRQVCEPDD